jgi:hypothetical protein
VTKHAVRHLRKTRGAIVNIASTRALQSEPDTILSVMWGVLPLPFAARARRRARRRRAEQQTEEVQP